MRPSSISTRRGMRAAMRSSWVITTIVVPAACSSSSSARMACPVAWSRLPVGSSASTIAGRPTSARAIATRCRSPAGELRRPGVAAGRPSPTAASASAARSPPLRDRHAGVQQPVGDVVEQRSRARRGRTAGTRTRSGWRAARRAAGRTGRDVQPGDPHGAGWSAGPGCPSGAAAWSCPTRTGRRPPPAPPRRRSG